MKEKIKISNEDIEQMKNDIPLILKSIRKASTLIGIPEQDLINVKIMAALDKIINLIEDRMSSEKALFEGMRAAMENQSEKSPEVKN